MALADVQVAGGQRHAALDDRHARILKCIPEVLTSPPGEVVENHNLGHVLIEQLIENIRHSRFGYRRHRLGTH